MGCPELGSDARFESNAARVQRADEVRALITAWTAERTMAELVAALAEQVPMGPVNTAREMFADPHVRARGMLVDVEIPGDNPSLTVAGPAIKMTETPPAVRRRAPTLGEHTAEILREVGLAADALEPSQP